VAKVEYLIAAELPAKNMWNTLCPKHEISQEWLPELSSYKMANGGVGDYVERVLIIYNSLWNFATKGDQHGGVSIF
jgi:hypothetical protein